MTHYKNVVESIEPLLSVCIKMADTVGNDEIRISKTRAKELLSSIRAVKKQIIKSKAKHVRKEPAWLDNPW